MEEINKRPNGWMLTLGILFLLVSVGIGGFFAYRYLDETDVDKLIFDTWLNEKRELFEKLADISAPVNNIGDPLRDDSLTRSGGGSLEWSVTLYEAEGEYLSSPALVDLNNNGDLEIVIASAGDYIYAIGSQGSYFWPEPYSDDVIDYLGQTPQTSGLDFDPPHIFASVIAADVNLGDTPEVIIGVKDGALCLGSDGQKQWKKGLTNGYYFSTACITDLEGEWTGEKEDLEIVLASDDESRGGWIEAFEVDGGAVFRESAPTGGEGGLIGCSVVAHDLDGDFWDGPELINPDPSKERDTELIIGNHDRGLRVWVRQGENSEGKPNYDETTSGWLAGHQTYATTAVANVTGDPGCEMFVGSSEGYPRTWTGWGGKLYVYNDQYKKLWDFSTGSSRASIFSSPAVADLQVAKDDPEEKHLDYEVIFGADNGNMYVLNTEFHSVIWSFNTGGRCMSSPAIMNIDNDDELEIVIGSDSGKVFCFDGDPSDGIDEGFPYPGDGTSQDVLWVYDTKSPIGISSPVVADIDLDGQLEVVIGDQEGHVWCISAGGRAVTGQVDWPEFHYDLNRTGFYNPQTSYGVDLYPRTGPDGRAEPLVRSIQPGETIIYNLTIENTGKGISEMNKDKIMVELDHDSVPEGWAAKLTLPKDQGIENPNYVMLASEQTAPVRLEVTAPWEGEIGEMARINLSANSTTDQWARDTATTLSILDLFVDFEMIYLKQASVDALDPLVGKKWDKINPGADQYYTVSILNKGNLNDTYHLQLNPPPSDTGWNWSFVETESMTADLTLSAPIFKEFGADSGATLTLKVKCPIDARKDTKMPVVIRATSLLSKMSDIEDITKTDELILVVGEHHELDLRVEDSTKYVNPNGTVEFQISITNLGNKDVIYVLLSIDNKQSGWDIRYPADPIPVFNQQTKNVPLTVKAPGWAQANSKLVLNVRGVIVDATNLDATAPLTVIVNHVYEFDAVVLEKEGVKVNPGDSAYFHVQISNLGNGEDIIKPTAYEIRLDWNLTFYNTEGYQKYEIPLDFESNIFITGRIKIPVDTRTERYVVGVNLTGEGFNKVVYVVVNVNQTFDLRVTNEEGENVIEGVNLQPNLEKPFIVKVANYGNGLEEVVLKVGQDYDPITDAMMSLYDGWEGKFVAVANTPDFTQNIRTYNFHDPIPVSNVWDDVYYTPNYTTTDGGAVEEVREIRLVLDKGMVAWVHLVLKAPPNEIGEKVNPVVISGRGLGGPNDWETVIFNVTVLFPDLEFVGDIEFSGGTSARGSDATVGDVLTIIVKVKNSGDIPAENVDVQLVIDGVEKKTTTLRTVKNESGDEKTVIFSWVAEAGTHEVKIVIDPDNTVIESRDESAHGGSGNNNEIERTVDVAGGNLVVAVVNDYPVVSTMLIMLLLVVILVGAAILLKSKKMI